MKPSIWEFKIKKTDNKIELQGKYQDLKADVELEILDANKFKGTAKFNDEKLGEANLELKGGFNVLLDLDIPDRGKYKISTEYPAPENFARFSIS